MFRTRTAGLVGPGRSCASFGDAFLTRTGDAHGVQWVLRSIAPSDGSADNRPTQPTCRSSPHHPVVFVPGRCWGILTLGSQSAKVRATRLLGFPAGQPYPADASARPLLPWTFFLSQVFECRVARLFGSVLWRVGRARMPGRPSTLASPPTLQTGKAIRSWAWTRVWAGPPFSVLQGRRLVHPEQPSKGKNFPARRYRARTDQTLSGRLPA